MTMTTRKINVPNEIDCMEVCVVDVPCPYGYDCEHEEAGRLNNQEITKGKTLMEVFAEEEEREVKDINLSEWDMIECLKECVNYLMESEYTHYKEWCERPWCDPEKHIYHSAEILQRWLHEIDQNPLSLYSQLKHREPQLPGEETR